MSLSIGSVTVASDGTATGSGMAKALYDGFVATNAATITAMAALPAPPAGSAPAPKPDVALKQGWAALCTSLATGLVPYITGNAVVDLSTVIATIGTSTHAGRVPNPATPGAAIDGPSSPVTLPVTAGAATTIGVS